MIEKFHPAQDGPKEVTCPQCGRVHSVSVVAVLRPGDEAVTRLFKGDLNVIHCPDCGRRFTLEHPLLYRDDERKCLIYYLPIRERNRWKDAEDSMRELTETIFRGADSPVVPRLRLTLSRREFIEKIALEMQGLDDRIIEYLKYQLYNRKQENPPDPARDEILFDFSQEDPEKLAFLIFPRSGPQARAAAHYPMDLYRELDRMVEENEAFRKELERLFPSYFVSVDRLFLE